MASRLVASRSCAGNSAGQHLAKTLLSLLLGFVAQSAILGDVEPEEIALGMTVLAKTRPRSETLS
ncbi:hypothetical protein [Pararhizobium arenae]|uniref:hypothetical protein n=1 Tax=Pararhizobium arenae TaxID=1856850 RepID=UPI00094B0E67|nr:hypothetical protein [Pararhizobium arenae]